MPVDLRRRNVPLASLTTLQLGGPAAELVEVSTAEETVAAVRTADTAGTPLLLVGGGSNLVVADDGWPGVVVLLRSRGVEVSLDGDTVELRVAAGEPWDELVARTVAEGWTGLECLSGIPGLAGATPVQNVGAYGQEVAETVRSVEVWDRESGSIRELSTADCVFGYRTSVFKHSDRYVVLSVRIGLRRSPRSGPVRYAELARHLDVEIGADTDLTAVRDTVLMLRRGKGMVLDEADHDTWSAGSFFTNPVVDQSAFEARLDSGASYPHWPAEGGVKLSAAWLIDRAGFGRGYGSGRVGLSGKHTLALTNRGGASTTELIGLARTVRDGVADRFGVRLQPEPRLVGVTV
ncbi:MAG TPA: UDP-N-acetylmuramate dehydrogenase [Mycobacteriales bacterium]|nr:UDP-N-acetylmuramate dehydrogenase [Mycobacteriales bacterium]